MHSPSAARPAIPALASLAGGVIAGTVLIVSGLTLEFASLVTPYVQRLAGGGQFSGGTASAAWFAAVAVGGVFLGVGAARLAAVLAEVRLRAGSRMVEHALGEGVAIERNVDIGDGRPIPSLAIGRFGVAVLRELPAPSVARHQGPYWEGRTDEGWIRIENPLDRASRDAERVRRWFATDDRDYVVKVYAAVIAPDASIPRTPTCAVITRAQLRPWFDSLPAQRSLNESRRAHLLRQVRGR